MVTKIDKELLTELAKLRVIKGYAKLDPKAFDMELIDTARDNTIKEIGMVSREDLKRHIDILNDRIADVNKVWELGEYYDFDVDSLYRLKKQLTYDLRATEESLEEAELPSHNCEAFFKCKGNHSDCMYAPKDGYVVCKHFDVFQEVCTNTLAIANVCTLKLKGMGLSKDQIKEMLK